MFPQLSSDVRKLVIFELEHGNQVMSSGSKDGYSFIKLLDPFHVTDPGFNEVLVETLRPWGWENPHYGEAYQGYRSMIDPNDAVVVRKREK